MLKEKLKWHSLADGNWPVSDEEVLLSTIKYGTVIGYYDIGDDAFFILSGAKPQVLRINEVIAWTDIPECDIKKPTAKFRLPTQEEFDKLCKCYTRFDEELKGRWFYDEETGEKLFLPCEGYSYKDSIFNDEILGNYWSSSTGPYQHCGSYYLDFTSNRINTEIDLDLYRRGVCLVSDSPFEGAIHVAGLYWKPENEEGFYTWDEAMEKFNN